ncbi:PAS domain S-box protein [Natronobiforma cellulositropha]|uniref:PAS domain S-box protein n=1 Tax=Natronobiforma cellulositropha TaxID=1679076 RepID=UPI0021D5D8CC|nr:PAS domain S-box protein [Natronobiforma cellulositropha]
MTTSLHVVYVDGTPRDDVTDAFRAIGAETDHVETLEAALALEVTGETCIVTESRLPDATGPGVCERIGATHPEVPLVVFTGDGSETLAGDLVAAGADGYVPHEAGVETLVSRVVELAVDRARANAGSHPALSRPHDELFTAQAPLAIIEWNREFEVVAWNDAATDLFGYTETEALGAHVTAILVPDEERDAVRSYWEHLRSRGRAHRTRGRNVRRDGSSVTCEWLNVPLVDETGTVTGLLSCVQDVTADHKRADVLEALQETTHDLMLAETPEEIARLTVAAVDDVIERPKASVRLYDEATNRLECAAVTERVRERHGLPPPIGPDGGLFWEVYDRQQPRVIDELTADLVPPGTRPGARNVALYPLGEHGLLAVASASPEPFDETDVRMTYVLAATAEAALDRARRQRELEQAKVIVETVGDGVYGLDREGTFVTVNETLAAMVGYSREYLLGSHVSTVLSETTYERGQRQIETLLRTGGDVATYELPLERRDGETITCELTTTVLREDGTYAGSVGTVRDVSARKRMERELRERKQKTTHLHEVASRLELCESDRELFEETVHAAAGVLNFDVCAVCRVEENAVAVEAVSSDLAADHAQRTTMNAIARTVVESQETYRTGIIDATDLLYEVDDAADGELVSYEPTDDDSPAANRPVCSALSIPVGRSSAFVALSTDVEAFDQHDQKLAELLLSHVADAVERMAFRSQLREERDRFAALFENVPDAVVSARHGTENDPVVERVNPAFEHVFGFDQADVADQPLDRFIVPTDRRAEADTINRRGAHGETVETEVKRRTSDGLRDFMMRVVPVDLESGADPERAFGVYTDITEQKQRQKRVEILNRVLRHDLRNGMNIINGCAEMLADVVEDETNRQYADVIQERAGELIGLAEKTRAVERTLDRRDGATGPIDIVDSVETAIETVENDLSDATITVSRSYPDDGVYARADDMLETAIHHVVENAVVHNDLPTTALSVSVDPADDFLTLSVADNGPGIPTEEQELLLEEKEITQLRHASGLGLWLVNWVVTHSGGTLSFAENEPRGTVVTLEIPVAEPPAAGTATGSATALE